MPAKSKTTERVTQAAEMLRDIYDRKTPEIDLGTRFIISRTLAHMARCLGIEQRKTKAETFLAIAEAQPDARGLSEFIGRLEYEYTDAKEKESKANPDSPYGVTERLRRFYLPTSYADHASLHKVTRRLYKLAEAAGLRDVRRRKLGERHMLYAESVALGFEQSGEAKELRSTLRECEEWIASWTKPEEEEKHEERRTAPQGRTEWHIVQRKSGPHLGFIAGDVVKATAADNIRAWEIVALWEHGSDVAHTGRVVAITKDAITVRFNNCEKTFDRSELEFLGRVDPEPIEYEPDFDLSNDERKRIADLEKQIEKLGREDDQILRCTKRYELEKQIFDIRHPLTTGKADNSDDWSAWEEGGEA